MRAPAILAATLILLTTASAAQPTAVAPPDTVWTLARCEEAALAASPPWPWAAPGPQSARAGVERGGQPSAQSLGSPARGPTPPRP